MIIFLPSSSTSFNSLSGHVRSVQFLIDHIPDETMKDVKNSIDQNGKDWWTEHHHGFGMGVRNLLREGGFEKSGCRTMMR